MHKLINTFKSISLIAKELILDYLFPKSKEVEEIEDMDSKTLEEHLPKGKFIDEETFALFDYKDERVRLIVWEIKYNANEKITNLIAEILNKKIYEFFPNLKNTFLLVPIPMSKKRLREKGFNQSYKIAEALYYKNNTGFLDFNPNVLKKIKETSTQMESKTLKQRKQNLKNSFKTEYEEKIQGQNIIIIDDVYTTGSTIKECRKVLKKAGAKKVYTLVIAH